ncbi:MAG TPA: carbohydrate-binding family 9-like protein [Candidatus Hydrogenedentes bacterium]|nr:carbohydrate-binding family 9-like protein [Candidatus Hydrogenedentota bacterium]
MNVEKEYLVMRYCAVIAVAVTFAAGCALHPPEIAPLLEIPRIEEEVRVDGILDESCYRSHPPFENFVVAGNPARQAPSTHAWLFWNEETLVCAFVCEDTSPAWMPPSLNEREVDPQDRVELFIWRDEAAPVYACIEAAPGGAVHDYAARFYRKFDDRWSPAGGWARQAKIDPSGYSIEMALPRAAMEAMGVTLASGVRFRLGLFRADYDVLDGTPVWITWVDHGREPDFHVADSFGTAVLSLWESRAAR